MSRTVADRAGGRPVVGMWRAFGLAALMLVGLGEPTAAADKLILQLHGPAQFEFAGYYAASWRGFYAESGLTVEIRPTELDSTTKQPSVDAVREVAEGRAQFGTGTAELVIRAAQGQPLLLLAPIFQQSGAAVFYRADLDYPSPAALLKARVGRLPASDILDVELVTALRGEGVDPQRLRSVPIDQGQALSALNDRTVDAAVGSLWDLPYRAREKSIALKSFNPADYRVEFYGDTLFTSQHFAAAEAATVQRFIAASLKGWDYALQHPDEVIGRLLAGPPTQLPVADPGGFARYQADVARRLSHFPDVPLGHSNRERWARIEASMATADALSRTTDPDAFVYDQERVARRSTDFKAIAWLIGAALLAVAIGGALLWLRRRSVPAVVAPASPSSEPVTAKAPLLPPAKLGPAAGAPVPGSGKAEPAAATPKSAETPPSAPAAALPAAAVPPPVAPVPAAVAAAPPASIAAPPVSAPMPAPMPGTLDLNLLLSGMERALRQRVPRRIELRLSLLPVLWDCRTEVRAVQRLILDLVASAVADMRAGGSLVVGTRNFVMDEAAVAGVPNGRPGDYVRVTVRDSGPGMPQEALGRVLDPSGPRPKIAAAAERMKGLGGFVRVESAEAVGTAVHLYFPRVPEAAAEDAAAGGKPAVAEDAGADGGKPAPAEDATSGAKPEATEGVASGGKPAAAAE